MQYNHNNEKSGGGFDPIPPGKYQIHISNAEDTKSKAGNEMIKLECTVMDAAFYGRLLWFYITSGHDFTDTQIGQVLASCGISKQTTEVNANTFIGQTATVKVKHKVYEGEMQAQISYFVEEMQPAVEAIASPPAAVLQRPPPAPAPVPPLPAAPAPAPVLPPAVPPTAPPVPPAGAPPPLAAPGQVQPPTGSVNTEDIPF